MSQFKYECYNKLGATNLIIDTKLNSYYIKCISHLIDLKSIKL